MGRTYDTSTLKMEAAYTFETSATSPTTTQCNNLRTDLTSTINHRGSMKSVITHVYGEDIRHFDPEDGGGVYL
jgi:hypothetical protein